MMQKVKEYLNGSMEPEPKKVDGTQNSQTDLETAGRVFYMLGVLVIAVSLVLFPAIGFQITLTLFGIAFIGISILLKSQDRIIKKLDSLDNAESWKGQTLDDSTAKEE
jgi:hypothetical protein